MIWNNLQLNANAMGVFSFPGHHHHHHHLMGLRMAAQHQLPHQEGTAEDLPPSAAEEVHPPLLRPHVVHPLIHSAERVGDGLQSVIRPGTSSAPGLLSPWDMPSPGTCPPSTTLRTLMTVKTLRTLRIVADPPPTPDPVCSEPSLVARD